MNVLVAVASKHGATFGIAETIAGTLRTDGCTARVAAVHDVGDLGLYDAVVIGSAVYAGGWMKEARQFVEQNAKTLARIPVWLFSSGPLGDPPKPDEDPLDASLMVVATGARGHRTFPGALHKDELGFGERTMVRAVHAPEGDFRDWTAVREWAGVIAEELARSAVV